MLRRRLVFSLGVLIVVLFFTREFWPGKEKPRIPSSAIAGLHFSFRGITGVNGEMPDTLSARTVVMLTTSCPYCLNLLSLLNSFADKSIVSDSLIIIVPDRNSIHEARTVAKEGNICLPLFVLDPNAVMQKITQVPAIIRLDKNQSVINSVSSQVRDFEHFQLIFKQLEKESAYLDH